MNRGTLLPLISLKCICGPVFLFFLLACSCSFARLFEDRPGHRTVVCLSGFVLAPTSLSVSTAFTERFTRCHRLTSRPSARASFCAFSIFRDCDVAFPGPISSFFPFCRQASPTSLLSTCFPFTSLLPTFHSGGSPVEPKRRNLLMGCLSVCPGHLSSSDSLLGPT